MECTAAWETISKRIARCSARGCAAGGGLVEPAVVEALEVDQEGRMVPSRGAAVVETARSAKVIAVMPHLGADGSSRLVRRCSRPSTGIRAVDGVVTDLGFFEVTGKAFALMEYFSPAAVEYILRVTDADIVVGKDCVEVDLG